MEWNNYSYPAYKANFFYKLLTRKYTFRHEKYEDRALAKVLILRIGVFLPLVLQNNYPLNAPNIRPLSVWTDKS